MESIILFDSNCNFCTKSINFLKRNDNKKRLSFYPINSQDAHIELKKTGIQFIQKNTVYLIHKQKAFTKSTAVLKALSILPFPYSVLSTFLIVPRFIRDAVYNLIAKNRHKL